MKPIQLANAKVGILYSHHLSSDKISTEDTLCGLEAIEGLQFSSPMQMIQGTPLNAGTFELIVKDTQGKVKRRFQLCVALNPELLWKDIASSQLIKKDDESLPPIDFHGKKLIAASRRGRSHQHRGEPREDDMITMLNKSDWLCCVLADGAGSAKCAALASTIATTYASSLLCAELDLHSKQIEQWSIELQHGKLSKKEFRTKLFHIVYPAILASHQKLVLQAKDKKHPLSDFHTTLLITLIKKLNKGYLVIGFQIGDGAIAVYSENHVQLLGNPDAGAFAGETRFLTDKKLIRRKKELSQRLFFEIIPDFKAIISMTDGVADPYFESERALTSLAQWDDLWEKLEAVHTSTREDSNQSTLLLDWLNFYHKGHHDDRSISLLF